MLPEGIGIQAGIEEGARLRMEKQETNLRGKWNARRMF